MRARRRRAACARATALTAHTWPRVLDELVANSLVTATTANGRTRYRLLETLREYATEQLDARGDTSAMRDRHVDHYVRSALAATARGMAAGDAPVRRGVRRAANRLALVPGEGSRSRPCLRSRRGAVVAGTGTPRRGDRPPLRRRARPLARPAPVAPARARRDVRRAAGDRRRRNRSPPRPRRSPIRATRRRTGAAGPPHPRPARLLLPRSGRGPPAMARVRNAGSRRRSRHARLRGRRLRRPIAPCNRRRVRGERARRADARRGRPARLAGPGRLVALRQRRRRDRVRPRPGAALAR